MKENTFTRVILNVIIAIVFSSKLIYSVTSLSSVNERIDHPRTDKHSVKELLRDSFIMTRDLTGQKQHNGSVPGRLRLHGDIRAMSAPANDYLHKFTHLPDVSAICSSTGLVLRVKRIFYGFSATPEELTLGETCKSNRVLEPDNDLLFIYALTDCQSEKQVLPEYIVYKFVLHYVPLSDRHWFWYHRVNVGVECRFERPHHVHNQVVRPTWAVPLRKSIRSRLGDFRIQLMDDSWSSPVRSAVYLLGQRVNVQVSTRHQYPDVKLYINSCYVTTTKNLPRATKHTIIDNFGCFRESRINPDARFRFTKADNIVQFFFGAFQFIEAPDAQVSLHCELSVSGGGPTPVQKACFYNHIKHRWISVFGHDSVCDCCDSVCNQTKSKRLIYEGFVSSDQVVFSDPVTSPFSPLGSSTLDSTLLAHNTDDAIWFEAKLAKDPQRSHTHQDFVASVTLRSSEDHAKKHESHTSRVDLKEGDVEILMATRESFVKSERPKVNTRLKTKETMPEVDSMEPATSLGWSQHGMRQNLMKGQSYWPKAVFGKGKDSIRMTGLVDEIVESSTMDDSRLGEEEPHEVILSSFNSKYGHLGFPSYSESEEESEFQVGLDELMEKGVVRSLDTAKDPEYYFISDK
ncbi:uncharacterized protein [Misgurnus anguillicaudatus]|uniref:uncharacterized protein n=1 Tax=Misgurnus anguillicaudatus TaxID=75329 RepID=UPI003CCFDA5B